MPFLSHSHHFGPPNPSHSVNSGMMICTLLTLWCAQFGVVPKRLFPAPDAPSAPSSHPLPLTTHSTGKLGESDARPPDGVPGPPTADGGTPATSTGSVVSGRVSCVLLEAMEGATRGLLSLHCRILRVYRRTLPSTTRLSLYAGQYLHTYSTINPYSTLDIPLNIRNSDAAFGQYDS